MQLSEIKQRLAASSIQIGTVCIVGLAGSYLVAQGVILTASASSTADALARLSINHFGGAYLLAGAIMHLCTQVNARQNVSSPVFIGSVRFHVCDTLSKIVTFQKYGAVELKRVVIKTCSNPAVVKGMCKLLAAELNEEIEEEKEADYFNAN